MGWATYLEHLERERIPASLGKIILQEIEPSTEEAPRCQNGQAAQLVRVSILL